MGVIRINPIIFEGAPAEQEGRLQKEMAVYALLDALSISYARLEHDPAGTIADCSAVEQILKVPICKNLFLCNTQKTQFYLLLMPGNKKFMTKELSKQLGCARLSFADAEAMEKYLNITPGSVSVLGLMYDQDCAVRLLIDEALLQETYIGCHPCVNTTSLKIRLQDILQIFLPHTRHIPDFVRL